MNKTLMYKLIIHSSNKRIYWKTQVAKSFIVRKGNFSLSVNILSEKVMIQAWNVAVIVVFN